MQTLRLVTPRRVSAALAATMLLAGCALDGSTANNTGQLRMVLSRDAGVAANVVADEPSLNEGSDHQPASWFESATVTLSSILLRTIDGVLVPLDASLPVDVDVIKIDGGKQVILPDGLLPADTYDQVVIVMSAVQGVMPDGTGITIDPPGGGWTAVIPICPLEVTDGGVATVGITLNVRNSFLRAGNHWSFEPRFRSHLECGSSGN